ncbi:MAG: flagellar hook-associated protein FlgK [Aureliella sp.]
MSLFASIQQSSNALSIAQIGLNVAGNNIANANTPGYIRQELVQTSVAGYRAGGVILGGGVRAAGVVQKIDNFLTERLRETGSELASNEALSDIYSQIEATFSEMGDKDLSTQLSNFSNSIQDVLNQPGNDALRRLVIERGKTLTGQIRSMRNDMTDMVQGLNLQIKNAASDINRLTSRIGDLNRRIVEMEGGRTSGSDAVGLRDERIQALNELSSLISIQTTEQPSGAVTVYIGGEYVVADGISRPVNFVIRREGEESYPEIHLSDTDSPLQITGGRVKGLYEARDDALGGAIGGLDEFARDLIEQFNRIHTQGQGQIGYSSTTGTRSADDTTAPLDLAGYSSTIDNGSFELVVHDLESGQDKTSTIRVQLNGDASDSSLEDIRDQISAVSGLSASITPDGRLAISTNNPKLQFAFKNDNSGFLTAAGLNTFFEGDSAASIKINDQIVDNPRLLAASLSGIGGGTENAVALAQAFDQPLAKLNGQSIKQNYEDLVVRTTQDISTQQGTTDGLRNFYKTLESQNTATSGVNLDEEAVKMIFYQRAFQASSRVIKASSDMLDILVSL